MRKKVNGLPPDTRADAPEDVESSMRELIGQIEGKPAAARKSPPEQPPETRHGTPVDLASSARELVGQIGGKPDGIPRLSDAFKRSSGASAPGKPGDPSAGRESSAREPAGQTGEKPNSGSGLRDAFRKSPAGDDRFRNQITTLYNALENEYITTAVETIDTMERTHNPEAAAVLVILLEYPDAAVRAHAALALGTLGGRDVVEPLIKALDDRTPQVCESAATALGVIGDNRAEIPLQKVPVDNPRVKRAAVNALARIESKRI